jgi:hypothetical protein
MTVPSQPKIYHIVHIDRLASIIADGCLWCDAEIHRRNPPGTAIGMENIKERRLRKTLASYPQLHVGDCVPFYFCPRSIMLYLFAQNNHYELTYHGGQEAIIHLEADLHAVVAWAQENNRHWAFTLSNAGSKYFEDRSDLKHLHEINWDAVCATDWREQSMKEGKQAEFLFEHSFPWHLVERVGVCSQKIYNQVTGIISGGHRPQIEIHREWYY